MAKTRRAYTGGAASTTTSSNILSSGTTSFTITAYTGWPYGSDPFYVVVEPGTANEEKILVTRTGSTDTTINVYATPSVAANRGADGTSAVAHSSGVTVFPVFTAVDADEANELTSSWSTKGDLVSYGSSTFETLGVGADDTVLIADSGEASGLKWSSSLDLSALTVSGNAAVDTDTLFVDATNDRVGVNDATPSYALDVTGDINTTGDLRIGGVAQGKWTTYTPTWTNLTVGNATVNVFKYAVVGNVMFIEGRLDLGSTSAITGTVIFSPPSGYTFDAIAYIYYGLARYQQTGVSVAAGAVRWNGSNQLTLRIFTNSGTYSGEASVNATQPFTWATGDQILVSLAVGVS